MPKHSYDVVGYYADRCPWCVGCLRSFYGYDALEDGKLDGEGNYILPLFAGSKWPSPLHCTRCGEPIEIRVLGG